MLRGEKASFDTGKARDCRRTSEIPRTGATRDSSGETGTTNGMAESDAIGVEQNGKFSDRVVGRVILSLLRHSKISHIAMDEILSHRTAAIARGRLGVAAECTDDRAEWGIVRQGSRSLQNYGDQHNESAMGRAGDEASTSIARQAGE